MKYTFNPGENIPAESFQTIDPDNPVAQSAGELTGGDNVSDIDTFEALAVGSNNGKFSINVDGIEYDDIALTLATLSTLYTTLLSNESTGNYYSNQQIVAQSFTLNKKSKLRDIDIALVSFSAGTFVLTIVEGEALTGTPLFTSPSLGISQHLFCDLGGLELEAGLYTFVFTANGNKINPAFSSDNSGSGSQRCYVGDSWWNENLVFTLIGIENQDYYDDIALKLQNAIRGETSKTEIVIWDTDHFKITSSTANKDSKILKLISPTTGTDITGNDTELYLDLGANATEVAGDGDEYKLVRLDENGKIKHELLEGIEEVDSTYIVQPSLYIKASSNLEVTATGTNEYVKLKEILYNDISGSLRVSFTLRASRFDYSTSAQIYKNGVAYGTLRSNKEVGTTYSEDLAFESGDLIQVYGYANSDQNNYAMVSSFSIAYDKVVKTKTNTVNL